MFHEVVKDAKLFFGHFVPGIALRNNVFERVKAVICNLLQFQPEFKLKQQIKTITNLDPISFTIHT